MPRCYTTIHYPHTTHYYTIYSKKSESSRLPECRLWGTVPDSCMWDLCGTQRAYQADSTCWCTCMQIHAHVCTAHTHTYYTHENRCVDTLRCSHRGLSSEVRTWLTRRTSALMCQTSTKKNAAISKLSAKLEMHFAHFFSSSCFPQVHSSTPPSSTILHLLHLFSKAPTRLGVLRWDTWWLNWWLNRWYHWPRLPKVMPKAMPVFDDVMRPCRRWKWRFGPFGLFLKSYEALGHSPERSGNGLKLLKQNKLVAGSCPSLACSHWVNSMPFYSPSQLLNYSMPTVCAHAGWILSPAKQCEVKHAAMNNSLKAVSKLPLYPLWIPWEESRTWLNPPTWQHVLVACLFGHFCSWNLNEILNPLRILSALFISFLYFSLLFSLFSVPLRYLRSLASFWTTSMAPPRMYATSWRILWRDLKDMSRKI